jgi:DNA-binding IclR family transcriptional regulator
VAESSKERTGKGGMQAVTRVAAVLEALAESGGDPSLAALAARAGLPKTTVHRIFSALEQVGYVRVDAATGQRGLGPALLRLAAIGRRDLRAVLEPHLERLSRDLNETVDLAVLDDWRVLFIAQHAAPQRELMAIARVGAHFPAYSMASGKVLLAQLPVDELRRRLPARLEPTPEGRRRSAATTASSLALNREAGMGTAIDAARPSASRTATATAQMPGRSSSLS